LALLLPKAFPVNPLVPYTVPLRMMKEGFPVLETL